MRDRRSFPPEIESGLYQGWNGDIYKVLFVSKNETNNAPDDEWLVNYEDSPLKRSLGGVVLRYTRTYEEFIEEVPDPADPEQSIPRFNKIDDQLSH